MEVWVMEFRTPKQDDWRVGEVFTSKRVAMATCADELDAALPEFGLEYRVRRYVPALGS